jgi:hypothetical protein
MRTILLLCVALAGCGVPPIPGVDGGPATYQGPDGSADVDAGAPETDAGPADVDAGVDAGGAECNPGAHTSACMNPASCIGVDSVCRPCC